MLEVTGIEKRYRGRTILKDVSFRANPGECIGIVGGNGCGKTTLLSILAGIRKPDRGSIRIDGQEALGRHRLLEEKIAYVPQENPLIPELTAFDNYRLWFRGKRREMERDLECGVGHVLGVDRFLKTQAGRLSGGEKKILKTAYFRLFPVSFLSQNIILSRHLSRLKTHPPLFPSPDTHTAAAA